MTDDTFGDQLEDAIQMKDPTALVSLLNDTPYDSADMINNSDRIQYALAMIDPNHLYELTTISKADKEEAFLQHELQLDLTTVNSAHLAADLEAVPNEAINDLSIYFEGGTRKIPLLQAVLMTTNENFPQPDQPQDSPFPAYEGSYLESVHAVLDRGVDPNVGYPLLTAIQAQNQDIVIALLNAGANPNVRTDDGNTAFTYALEEINRPEPEMVQAFLDHGADIHHPNALVALVGADHGYGFDYETIIDMLIEQGLSQDEIYQGYEAITDGPIKEYIYDTYSPEKRSTELY